MLNCIDKPKGSQIFSPLPVRPILEPNFGYGYRSVVHGPIFSEANPVSPGYQSVAELDVCGDLYSDPRVVLPMSPSQESQMPSSLPCKPNCVHRLAAVRKLGSSTVFDNSLLLPGKNVIDLDRIARGLDTRTTVYAVRQLRNSRPLTTCRLCSAIFPTKSISKP